MCSTHHDLLETAVIESLPLRQTCKSSCRFSAALLLKRDDFAFPRCFTSLRSYSCPNPRRLHKSIPCARPSMGLPLSVTLFPVMTGNKTVALALGGIVTFKVKGPLAGAFHRSRFFRIPIRIPLAPMACGHPDADG